MDSKQPAASSLVNCKREVETLHPAWRAFIRYCANLRHGEIDRLSIQDGLPVLAQSTTKKVKFIS